MAKNRFSKFVQPKESITSKNDKDTKTKGNKLSDTQSYLISTHTVQESSLDILISEDLIDSKPIYLEVSVSDQAAKFVVMATEDSTLQYKEKGLSQISILRSITNLYKVDYDINFRFQANFRIINDDRPYRLNQVAILLKDHFFSRRDQMQINRKLLKQTCYTNKQISFGTSKIQVTNLLMGTVQNQDYAYTGIITKETIILYRALEAKLAILIEISQETFQPDAVEEITLESMQKFIKIFQLRNAYFQTNHKLEIILYARIYYPDCKTIEECKCEQGQALQYDFMGNVCMDVYRKILQRKPLKYFDQMNNLIVQEIQEFLIWINCKSSSQYYDYLIKNYKGKEIIKLEKQGMLCNSKNSNLLEAITLVSQNFRQDHTTRSLTNSGHALLILSAGNGYFFGELQNYKIAKSNIMRSNIICYINVFGRIPNITGPMFQLVDEGRQLSSVQKQIYFDRQTNCNSQQRLLRHAYWIQVIKYNDEFLRSFFNFYDKQGTNEYFYLCLKKQKQISYSQGNFTLHPYALPKEIYFSAGDFDQKIQKNLNQLDQILKCQMSDPQPDSQIEQQQVNLVNMNPSMPNIFNERVYHKTISISNDQPVEPKPKPIPQLPKLNKVLSHNRMKWNLFYWDSKAHGFLFQMKEIYHKQFKHYLQNSTKDNESNALIFGTEALWKNLTYIPLVPLKTNMCYKDLKELRTSPVTRYVLPQDRFEEFEQQVKGIILSDNYQIVEGDKPTDEYQQELQYYKLQNQLLSQQKEEQASKFKFIKGGQIVTLIYDRNLKNYNCEVNDRKQQKYLKLPNRYGMIETQICYHPILYRYLLFGEQITFKSIMLDVQQENDIKTLLTCFDKSTDYTTLEIQNMKPKGISLIFVPSESLNLNNKLNQSTKFQENFNNLIEQLKNEIPCFRDFFKVTIYQKKKEIPQKPFNQFNLKYSSHLKDYKFSLHPERYEQVCVSQQSVWYPNSVFHINFHWISSGTLPLMMLQQTLKSCANQNQFTLIQIPRTLEQYFAQSFPFESIYRLTCMQGMKEIKAQIKYSPFECYNDCSNSDQIYINRKGLFFLKFEQDNILWKENVLLNEMQANIEVIKDLERAATEIDFKGVFEKLQQQIIEENEEKLERSTLQNEQSEIYSLDEMQKDKEALKNINEQVDQELVNQNDGILRYQIEIFLKLADQEVLKQMNSQSQCGICSQQFGVLKKKIQCKFCAQCVCKEHGRKKRQNPQADQEFHEVCDDCDMKYIKLEVQQSFIKKRNKLLKEINDLDTQANEIMNQTKILQNVISDHKLQHVRQTGEIKQVQNQLIFKISKLQNEMNQQTSEQSILLNKQQQIDQTIQSINSKILEDEKIIVKRNEQRYLLEQETEKLENQLKSINESIQKVYQERQDQRNYQAFSYTQNSSIKEGGINDQINQLNQQETKLQQQQQQPQQDEQDQRDGGYCQIQ